MFYKDKTPFWTFITFLAIVLMTISRPSSSIRVPQRLFQLKKNPQQGPRRLGKGWIDKSRKTCARKCMQTYETCYSFLFNAQTGLCTPASLANEHQLLPNADEGELYESASCDTSKGFKIVTRGATMACVARFGPDNYTNADADCQSKGGYLMSVTTVEKYYILYYNVSKNTNTWIGCDDIVEEGKFVWKEDGHILTDKEKTNLFASGEPNDFLNSEDCITIVAYSQGLMDYNCSHLHNYACEMRYP